MRHKSIILLLLLLFCRPDVAYAKGWKKFILKGRVVDSEGRPVPGARIIIWPPERPRDLTKPVDGLVISFETEPDGSFRAEGAAPSFPERWTLYVTSAIPPGTDPLVTPPFNLQEDVLDRLFAFPRVVVRKEEVSVGDVRILLHHSSVHVKLLTQDGSPAFTEADARPSVRLRVKDVKGRVVEEINLSERAFRKSESSFAVSLPNGKWGLEVKYKRLKAQADLDVPDRSGRLDAVLRLR